MRDTSPGADDCFHPPPIPIEVGCLHCGEAYDSYLIHWVEDDTFENGGYWACPTPGCDGKGFCFDIWPTDPEWRDENGEKVWFDDVDCEDDESLDFDDVGDNSPASPETPPGPIEYDGDEGIPF